MLKATLQTLLALVVISRGYSLEGLISRRNSLEVLIAPVAVMRKAVKRSRLGRIKVVLLARAQVMKVHKRVRTETQMCLEVHLQMLRVHHLGNVRTSRVRDFLANLAQRKRQI
jgi:hypothetical protein